MSIEENVNVEQEKKQTKVKKKFKKRTAFSLIFITLIFCVGLLLFLSNQFLGYSEGSLNTARIEYNKRQVDKSPNNPELRINLGYSYFLEGDYTSALEQYETALNLKKDFYPAVLNQAITYQKMGKTNKALESATKAAQLNKTDSTPHFMKGQLYKDLKKYNKAEEELNISIGLEGSSADAYYELGLVYEKMGKKQDAINSFQTAIDFNPVYKEAIAGLKRVKK